MSLVRHTVRLAPSLDKALRALAERQGVSVYAMLQRSVNAGIGAIANPQGPDAAPGELVGELASIGARVADVEQMIDRALFTACAAYGYARSAALGTEPDEDAIAAEIDDAYNRQRRLARERAS